MEIDFAAAGPGATYTIDVRGHARYTFANRRPVELGGVDFLNDLPHPASASVPLNGSVWTRGKRAADARVPGADINGDDFLNGSDFALLAGNFGKSLPPPPAAVVATAPSTPASTRATAPARQQQRRQVKPARPVSPRSTPRPRPRPRRIV